MRRRAVGEKKLVLVRSFADGLAIPRADALPIQVRHHLIDIGSRLRAKIEMIGMLVHVDGQDRGGALQAVCVVRCPVVNQPAQALGPGEDRPARTACQSLRQAGELGTPRRYAAEIALERPGKLGGGFFMPRGRTVALSAERLEIDLVQDHGARGNQLFALQAVDLEDRGARPVKSRKTRPDGVQAPHRAAVVVYVMADDQFL